MTECLSDEKMQKLATAIAQGLLEGLEAATKAETPGDLGLILRDLTNEIREKERIKRKEIEREKRISKIDKFLDIDPRTIDFSISPLDVKAINRERVKTKIPKIPNVPIGV